MGPNAELRREREARGWSLEDAADHLAEAVIRKGWPGPQADSHLIGRWERGERTPRPRSVQLLCDLYGKTPTELGLGPREGLPALADDELKRRHFLQSIAVLGGATMLDSGLLGAALSGTDIEAELAGAEADIETCWRLMRGSDSAAAEPLLFTRLGPIEALAESAARSHAPYNARLRRLATEGRILAALAAVLRCDYAAALESSRRAVAHSQHAGDVNLQVAALKHLATRYQDVGYPLRTLQVYQEALRYEDRASPLLRSRTHLGLALAYAKLGEERAGLTHLQTAEDEFPARFADDPAFSYADCGPSSLNHYGGLILLSRGDPRAAWETFEKLKELNGVPVPERTVLEILNCQAEAAVTWRDLDLACSHVEAAAQGATRLRSEMRFQEARRIFDQMRAVWPQEPRMRALEVLFRR
jgi:transcriptional regulator with XRE-family HTH domain